MIIVHWPGNSDSSYSSDEDSAQRKVARQLHFSARAARHVEEAANDSSYDSDEDPKPTEKEAARQAEETAHDAQKKATNRAKPAEDSDAQKSKTTEQQTQKKASESPASPKTDKLQ